jgi:hypothetical protein
MNSNAEFFWGPKINDFKIQKYIMRIKVKKFGNKNYWF